MKKLLLVLLLLGGIYFTFTKWDSQQIDQENWSVSAKAMILMDAKTGKVLYKKNSVESLPIASMTKLMTQYIILNSIQSGKLSWDTEYKPSAYVQNMNQLKNASKIGMAVNQTYTVRELFTAMSVISANDAAIALAELVGGTEEQFVAIMNEQAKAFGLKHTTFYNSSGLDGSYLGKSEEETNLSSAHDMAIIAQKLINKHPEVLEFTKMQSFTTNQEVKMWNTNLLLPGMPLSMEGIDGLKTGYTDAAGSCFAGTGVFNGNRVISVVIGVEEVHDDKSNPRFTLTREMIERFTN
ncbi:D-alanyl-D-alanine carboxypeptidase family protein [Sporosarcina obsidiansis]|uniref:D-alanyl-D-alanine carboxypeptidase family protein n=1 Tax=Sporosarcina obsidiansis TaxID=2660748 RepID=UPI00129BAFC1|nr:D-alanyl-D-alanine carboxypeptidase family protein [Sporosarcina obsidiansis]